LIVSVLVLVGTAAAFVIYEVFTFKVELIRSVSTLAAVIADNSIAALNFDNPGSAEEILSALKAEPDITAAALYDGTGKVFAKYPAGIPIPSAPPVPGSQGAR